MAAAPAPPPSSNGPKLPRWALPAFLVAGLSVVLVWLAVTRGPWRPVPGRPAEVHGTGAPPSGPGPVGPMPKTAPVPGTPVNQGVPPGDVVAAVAPPPVPE